MDILLSSLSPTVTGPAAHTSAHITHLHVSPVHTPCVVDLCPPFTLVYSTHMDPCVQTVHIIMHAHTCKDTHTHTHNLHGHSQQTLDVCEGSIQRPLECWKLYPSWNPRQVPADSPPLISAKGWGSLPSSSHPAMAHLCLFSPFSLSPPSHVPQGAPRTNIPSKCYYLWVCSPPACPLGWGWGLCWSCSWHIPGTWHSAGSRQAWEKKDAAQLCIP